MQRQEKPLAKNFKKAAVGVTEAKQGLKKLGTYVTKQRKSSLNETVQTFGQKLGSNYQR